MLGLGYLVSGIVVVVVLAATAVGWRLGLHPVLAFWIIYVLTRPLGASIGDYLSQPRAEGGLGLGATLTSLIFGVGIVAIVVYLTVSKADVIRDAVGRATDAADRAEAASRGGLLQTVVVVGVLLAAGTAGYFWRAQALQDAAVAESPIAAEAPAPDAAAPMPGAAAPNAVASAAPKSKLGDVSQFRTITHDTRDLLDRGDQAGATARITDLETAWDDAQARLKPRDPAAWTALDDKIDTVLRELRSTSPDPTSERAALDELLTALG